ncbi:MAG TPA: winged helix-turn-helix domain-containing protein [Stellaceae bacterium]|nr:winged helix-turn-helix domain-containing protein [Stellaceae bacterium]
MARLTIRIDLAQEGAIGPGKIRLLELVGETGSISAAGRAMEMSYRRAWLLIDALNHLFKTPLVATKLGGKSGGGAALTPFGREVVRHYRALEDEAEHAVRPHLRALEAALARRKPPRRSTADSD